MRLAKICVIAILLFGVVFLWIPLNVDANAEEFLAMVIDLNGVENRNIHDLYLKYYRESGMYYYSDSAKSMQVRRGESELTIPLSTIKEIEFEWAETVENSTVTVTTLSGDKVKGEPLRVSHWSFKGETDFGDFKLSVRKTKKVIFYPPGQDPTSILTPAGFEAVFAFAGFLAVAYLIRKKNKN